MAGRFYADRRAFNPGCRQAETQSLHTWHPGYGAPPAAQHHRPQRNCHSTCLAMSHCRSLLVELKACPCWPRCPPCVPPLQPLGAGPQEHACHISDIDILAGADGPKLLRLGIEPPLPRRSSQRHAGGVALSCASAAVAERAMQRRARSSLSGSADGAGSVWRRLHTTDILKSSTSHMLLSSCGCARTGDVSPIPHGGGFKVLGIHSPLSSCGCTRTGDKCEPQLCVSFRHFRKMPKFLRIA